jgi:hypothetical protein
VTPFPEFARPEEIALSWWWEEGPLDEQSDAAKLNGTARAARLSVL